MATDTDRPELQRLLADVRAGKLDIVCVTKIDRITRSLLDFYSLWNTFEEHGVAFISLDDNFDTNTATGRAMVKMGLVFAELEKERTSERTKEKVQARRGAGLWYGGTIPFGYMPHPTNKKMLEVDPVAAEIVKKEIFERFVVEGSVRRLAKYLAKHGIKRPKRNSTRGNSIGGGFFAPQSLGNVLANLAYTGLGSSMPPP